MEKAVICFVPFRRAHRHEHEPHRGQDEPGGNRDDERGHLPFPIVIAGRQVRAAVVAAIDPLPCAQDLIIYVGEAFGAVHATASQMRILVSGLGSLPSRFHR